MRLANGNNLGLLANMSSGDEQTITTSSKINGDALATSRPLFVGRNTVTTPPIYQYDARYTRSLGTYWERVTPKLIIEGNNIFNRSNVTTILTDRDGRDDCNRDCADRYDHDAAVVCKVEHTARGSDSAVWLEDRFLAGDFLDGALRGVNRTGSRLAFCCVWRAR